MFTPFAAFETRTLYLFCVHRYSQCYLKIPKKSIFTIISEIVFVVIVIVVIYENNPLDSRSNIHQKRILLTSSGQDSNSLKTNIKVQIPESLRRKCTLLYFGVMLVGYWKCVGVIE